MTYCKLGNVDISNFVSGLKITTKHNYSAQTNANGDSVVDYINQKKKIEIQIIPLEEDDYQTVLEAVLFNQSVSYRNPATGELSTCNCIISSNDCEYYTIQTDRVMYKKMKIVYNEL